MGFGTYTNLSAFLSAALPTIAVYGNHVPAKSTGALLKAIEYIETNYATITSIDANMVEISISSRYWTGWNIETVIFPKR